MRLLGIDYGKRRVGIALSDEGAKFAIPLIVLINSKNLLKEITEIADNNRVREIVLGESKNYKGEANAIFEDSQILKKNLESIGYIVHMELEFMSSMQAERLQGKNDMLDAQAAAIVLQSFLDKRENNA